MKAKVLIAYIISHEAGYDLTVQQMVAQMKESADTIYAGLKELVDQGYLVRHRRRGERGRMGGIDWEVIAAPDKVLTTSGFSPSGGTRSGEASSGGSDTKKTTPKNTKVQEDHCSEKTTSLSANVYEDVWAKVPTNPVPTQRREREGALKDQKFKTNGHRILARFGWNEAWADYILDQLEWRNDVNSMPGWIINADKNGTLIECVREVIEDYNAEHGKTLVANPAEQLGWPVGAPGK